LNRVFLGGAFDICVENQPQNPLARISISQPEREILQYEIIASTI
jgi:hypothetical protein